MANGNEPFGTWLRRQDYRNDPIGDLARDFKAGGSRAYALEGVRRDLTMHHAAPEAWKAFDRAVEEWTS